MLSLLSKHATTLFYFTKSDIKTTVIPVTMFATFASPIQSKSDLLQVICWVWLHLLQFDLSNQCIGVEEDKLNKPDRPIPSGRISLENAWRLRWALIPICVAYSALYSTPLVLTSLGIALLTIVYNELGVHAGHWMGRNLSIALDYGLFELGATYVGGVNKGTVDTSGLYAVLISISILATTYHVQDFKDHDGDRAIGRKTFPIVHPVLSRWQIFIAMMLWSLAVSYFWQLNMMETSIIFVLGAYVGLRFFIRKDRRKDQVSFYWYNIWLSAVNCLIGVWRLRQSV